MHCFQRRQTRCAGIESAIGTSIDTEGGTWQWRSITERVGADWRNWKKFSGVMCNRKMPTKLKGKEDLQHIEQTGDAVWGSDWVP